MPDTRRGLKNVLPLAALLVAGCIPQTAERGGYTPASRQPYDPTAAPRYDQDARTPPPQRPAWEMRPVTASARRVEASSYTVRSGDTLRRIADRTGAGSEAIARANNLAPPFTIYPGQRLAIPAGTYHVVRSGETGIGIAQAYGVDWGRMVTLNDLEEPYILRAGMRVMIPNTGPETLEERAARFHIDIDDIVTGGQPAVADNGRPARPSPSTSRELPATTPVAPPSKLAGSFRWPVKGTIVKRFGPGASGERNDGIKIAVPLDTPVLAAADGVVAYVGDDVPALGGVVILRHGDAWTSVYGHTDQLLVKRGQSVKKGQTIALSGESGFADRPELHFELRQGRTPVDPVPRLPAR